MQRGKTDEDRPILNIYPDSIGDSLTDTKNLLSESILSSAFRTLYILPSIFNSDLDRGFSIIDYGLNEALAKIEDLEQIKELGISLKLDFVLNHASVLSEQFQDILKNGDGSVYKDFFIDWNKFWERCGALGEEGYIIPENTYIKDMHFRKLGLPILTVTMANGERRSFWNTFYQQIVYRRVDAQDLMECMERQYTLAERLAKRINEVLDKDGKLEEIDFNGFEKYQDKVICLMQQNARYLGQLDLNIKSPLVWRFYEETIKKLSNYGATIVRLDAFAYAHKELGTRNFLNNPGNWEFLEKVRKLADKYQITLLPEIHAAYSEKIHLELTEKGYMTYDFFLPGILIHALEKHSTQYLGKWLREIQEKNIKTVNMLGCHDGIPVLDLKGLMPEEDITELANIIVKRGGYIKDLHGERSMYYQVNATYYSALGEVEEKMLLARAIQLFMPGKPQVWYLDLFAGKNDYEAVKRGGAGSHKEINRTNLSLADIEEKLQENVVKKQIELLNFRNQCVAFGEGAEFEFIANGDNYLQIKWKNGNSEALLEADLKAYSFKIVELNEADKQLFIFIQE